MTLAGWVQPTFGVWMNEMTRMAEFDPKALPRGIRSRFVDDVNGLRMHILEAGFESGPRPCVLLLHGFPELAYSWRKVMVPLADAGFHVIAPDQRGYGRTSGWDPSYDGDVASFRMLNVVRDALALVDALGYRSVAAVVGHDFGSPVAAYGALIRPDVFRSVALMSAPFDGPPGWQRGSTRDDIHAALAALKRPRKHYQWYYSTRVADDDMRKCPQGIAAFLRAYYYAKSADWPGNDPHPLPSWTAAALAELPTYYIMDLERGMAETALAYVAGEDVGECPWLTDAELQVYADEFGRTGFQGGLQWYRCATGAEHASELRLFAGRRIEVPACYIAGEKDWGVYQKPGAFEAMQSRACTRMTRCALVPQAGHWVQQEQPHAVVRQLKLFLADRTG